MNIAVACFHWLHICVGKVRDAYNHGQCHGITPIHAQEWRNAELRQASSQEINVWQGAGLAAWR